MIVKKPEYKTVTVKQRQLVSEAVYGCDCCGAEFKSSVDLPLDLTAYQAEDEAVHYEFCSWGCVINFLPKVKSDSFIELPFVHCGDKSEIGINSLLKVLSTRQP